MRKLLLLIAFLPFAAFAQFPKTYWGTTAPTGSAATSPTYRVRGTDSLIVPTMQIGGKYYDVLTWTNYLLNYYTTPFVNTTIPNGSYRILGLGSNGQMYKLQPLSFVQTSAFFRTLNVNTEYLNHFGVQTFGGQTNLQGEIYAPALTIGIQDTGKHVMIGNTNGRVYYDATKYASDAEVTTQVATISDMIAYSGNATALAVKDTTGSGGIFVYKSAGTVNNFTVFAATGKGTGVWVRLYNTADPINIEWNPAVRASYNVKTHSGTPVDCYAAIDGLIASFPNRHVTIKVPARYPLAYALSNSLKLGQNTTIIGDRVFFPQQSTVPGDTTRFSSGSTFYAYANTPAFETSTIASYRCQSSSITDICVVGTGKSGGVASIRLPNNASNSQPGLTRLAGYHVSDFTTGIDYLKGNDVEITLSDLVNCRVGIRGSGNSMHMTMTEIAFCDTLMKIKGALTQVINNQFSISTNGIRADSLTNSIISDNVIYNITNDVITIGSGSISNTIARNTMPNPGRYAIKMDGAGIDNSIIENQVTSNNFNALYARQTNQLYISNNKFIEPIGSVIAIRLDTCLNAMYGVNNLTGYAINKRLQTSSQTSFAQDEVFSSFVLRQTEANAFPSYTVYNSGGSNTSPAFITNGSEWGNFQFTEGNPSNSLRSAHITAVATETHTLSAQGTGLNFYTKANGTTTEINTTSILGDGLHIKTGYGMYSPIYKLLGTNNIDFIAGTAGSLTRIDEASQDANRRLQHNFWSNGTASGAALAIPNASYGTANYTQLLLDAQADSARIINQGIGTGGTNISTLAIRFPTIKLNANSLAWEHTGGATGGVLYKTSSSAMGELAAVATGNVLKSQGTGTLPIYGKVTNTELDTTAGYINTNGLRLLLTGRQAGDILVNGISTPGFYGRLGIGSTNQVLSVVSGMPAWKTFVPDSTAGYFSTNGLRVIIAGRQTGDMLFNNSYGYYNRLAIGSSNQILSVVAGLPAWITSPYVSNPMTTLGDMIYQGVSGSARLAGNNTTTIKFLTSTGSGGVATAPAYFDLFGTANTWSGTQTFGAIVPTSVNGVSAATMAFMDATSSVQTQLNAKGSGTVTNVTSANSDIGVSTGTTTPVLTFNRSLALLTPSNLYTTSATPGIGAISGTVGTGSGGSATIATGGTNQSGTITITTGSSISGSGTLVIVTMSGGFAYPNSTSAILQATNDNAALLATKITVTGSATDFSIVCSSALAPSTTYTWNYINIGN